MRKSQKNGDIISRERPQNEFACLFHAEFAEFAEKEIPIILRILREIKNILREKGRKEMVTMPILHRASSVSSSCLCRYFAMTPLLNGDRTDIERTLNGGIKKAFRSICFTQNSQNTQRKKFP